MRWPVLVAFAALALGVPQVAAAAPTSRFEPLDECARLPGIKAFRSALAGAIRQRDAAGVACLAGEDGTVEFCGGELAALLPLGCAMQDGQIVLPRFFALELGGEEPFEVLLVTGRNVPLRAAASAGAAKRGSLSWQLVAPLSGGDAAGAFRQVRTSDGRTGYVEAGRLRSQLDYRLLAVPVGTTWRITALVAGD